VYQNDVQTLIRLLLYATSKSRRRLAERLVDEKNAEVWDLLAITARSKGDPLLRARCLEVLALAAAAADEQLAEVMLTALLG
jgi:hypothetical protein